MNKDLKNLILSPLTVLYKINPILEQKLLFRIKCGYSLNLKAPTTYNEKLNWLKLFYRNKLMPICADKYLARSYIKNCGFDKYLPNLYWHGHNVADIPFNSLPNSFVIKSTSGSGNNIIVKNKYSLNLEKTYKTVSKWMKEKYLPAYGEWHYESIKPQILIEEYLSDGLNTVPIDYKFFCFNNVEGEIKVGCIAVDLGRFVNHKRNIYDKDFKFLANVDFGFPNDCKAIIKKPAHFRVMCEIAEKLSKPFPHCRVDFFVINERIFIGELTFFNGAGFDVVSPLSYNLKMGNWIDLSKIKVEELFNYDKNAYF